MKLDKLFKIISGENFNLDNNVEVEFITNDSRKVISGSVYFGFETENSEKYLKEALKNGAVAVVSQKKLNINIPNILVESVENSYFVALDVFYGNPFKKFKTVGVVGTNGKTSTCHIIRNVLNYVNKKSCIVGTLGVFGLEKKFNTSLTTPSVNDLYEIANECVKENVEYFVVELSAHAISQRRFGNVIFDIIIFTNCTEDHLDYFKDFEYYKNVKKSVFIHNYCKIAVINSDDKLGVEIINENNVKCITYGIINPSDVFAINIEEQANGTKFVVNCFDYVKKLGTALLGLHNVYNILASITALSLLGIKINDILNGVEMIEKIDGRLEKIGQFNGATIFCDYAHTPDGLKKALVSMRDICPKRLICLFGCGGNREKEKRGKMGKISGEIADFTIITSDNPRYEEPCQIIREIELGVRQVTKKYICVQDRKSAIKYALGFLQKDDVLLLAGKGAEEYQEILGEKRIFNDKKVVYELIENFTLENGVI